MGFFGSARSRYAGALERQKGLYKNGMMTNARAKNAARAQQKEATRALWSARRRRVMELLGKAGKGAAALTKKAGKGLATGGLAVAGMAAAAIGAAAQGAKMLTGKAYGGLGAGVARAAAAAKAAVAKVRSYSVGRRAKNLFLGKKTLTDSERALAKERGMNPNSTNFRKLVENRRSFARAAGNKRPEQGALSREGGLLRAAAQKTKAFVSATRKAIGAAGAAISKGASNLGGFLGRKAGNARNYASRKAGNLRKGLSNMYTRMRFGGHEKRLDAERQRAANAVNAAKASLNRNSSAKAKAAGRTLGEIAAKLKKADVAAANGSHAAAATAIGAAATAAKSATKKGFFSKLSNAAKNFTRGVGARLGKLRNMFKGTKKNNAPASSPKAMFTGSSINGANLSRSPIKYNKGKGLKIVM